MVDFSGIWVPLVTPFCNGQLDHPALHRLVQHLAAQGVVLKDSPTGTTWERG